MRQREEGCCYAYSRADGSCYSLQRAEYPRLLADWMAGKAFFTGFAFYGSTITLKLGDIVAVADTSAEELALGAADRRADAKEDALEG